MLDIIMSMSMVDGIGSLKSTAHITLCGMLDISYCIYRVIGLLILLISNETGYMMPDPVKFPDGIEVPISYIHSKGLKYGHYTNAGVNACGGAINSSENWLPQDVSLFASWEIDMIKVDNCDIKGNTTEIIFNWRDALSSAHIQLISSYILIVCL